MLVHLIVALGTFGFRKTEGVSLVRQALRQVSKATHVELVISSVDTVPNPREFGPTPEERAAQNAFYFPLQTSGQLTIVLAPPLSNGGITGVASIICGDGVAIVNALGTLHKTPIARKLDRITARYVEHEVLHLLGARHEDGGVMANPLIPGITESAIDNVNSCVNGTSI